MAFQFIPINIFGVAEPSFSGLPELSFSAKLNYHFIRLPAMT